MEKSDLKEVLVLERASFEQPYSEEIFEQELKIHAAHLWVATQQNKIVGYIDFWLIRDEVELVSIAVSRRLKRRGIGERLLDAMIQFASDRGVRLIYLDVRTSNHPAQRLYEKFGFHKVGIRRRYYSDNQEDALMMKKEI